MEIINVSQGSPEWWEARAGIPTGSEFGRIITPSTGKLAAGRTSYQAELIAEGLGWRKTEFRGSPDIERGLALEAEARSWAALAIGEDVDEVGFILGAGGRYGASPDGLIGGTTPVELKCPDVHTMIKYHMEGNELPREYRAQVHGHMVVTGSQTCWFAAYSENPRVRNMLILVERDEFTEALAAHLETFCDELKQIWERVVINGNEDK